MTSRLLLGICKTSLAFSTAIWAYIYFLYKGLKEFTFIFKHNIYVMSIFWIVIVRFEMLLGCNRVYTRCYCSSYMNALSIGWKKTKVIFCCTYCLWRVGTSVGRWEGSVHWLKVLNPGLGFSLPRGGLNTAGFGVGHLGSVRCALRLSHWNWETPSWGVQVAGDRQHEERERVRAREKRESEREREDSTTRLNTSTEIPRSSEKRPTTISPVVRNLVHCLPRVWVTSVRGRTENLSSGRKESIKIWKCPATLLHAHRERNKAKTDVK